MVSRRTGRGQPETAVSDRPAPPPSAPLRISLLGCGWLGLPLAAALAADGHSVRGATTTPAKLPALRRCGVTPHLLRLAPAPEGDLDGFFDADLLLLTLPPSSLGERFLEGLAEACAAALAGGVRWLVHTSSTGVYAAREAPDAAGLTVTEEDVDPAAPPEADAPTEGVDAPGDARGNDGRGAAGRRRRLRRAEALLWAQPAAVTLLRPGGLYGPSPSGPPREPGRFLAGRRELPDPAAPVNLIHVEDAVRAVREVVRQRARDEVFNLVADAHPTRRDFYRREAARLGLEPPRFRAADPHTVRGKRVSSAKLQRRLGFAFRHRPGEN